MLQLLLYHIHFSLYLSDLPLFTRIVVLLQVVFHWVNWLSVNRILLILRRLWATVQWGVSIFVRSHLQCSHSVDLFILDAFPFNTFFFYSYEVLFPDYLYFLSCLMSIIYMNYYYCFLRYLILWYLWYVIALCILGW